MKSQFTAAELGHIQAALRASAVEAASNAVTMRNIGYAEFAAQCAEDSRKFGDLADRIEAGEFDGQGGAA
jgi:hypothetical protein